MRFLRENQQSYNAHYRCALPAQLAVADQELPIPLFQLQHGAHYHCVLPAQQGLREYLVPLPQQLNVPYVDLFAHLIAPCAKMRNAI